MNRLKALLASVVILSVMSAMFAAPAMASLTLRVYCDPGTLNNCNGGAVLCTGIPGTASVACSLQSTPSKVLSPCLFKGTTTDPNAGSPADEYDCIVPELRKPHHHKHH